MSNSPSIKSSSLAAIAARIKAQSAQVPNVPTPTAQVANIPSTTQAITPPAIPQSKPNPTSALAALKERIAARNASSTLTSPTPPSEVKQTITVDRQTDLSYILDKYGNQIQLNSKQMKFVEIAASGQSAVLLGAAGTGKTTSQRAVIQGLIQSGRAGLLGPGHKHLPSGTPGIVICAYTRRAVANIKRNVPPGMEGNCITIHKLLEYQPEYYEVFDEETGEERTKMAFKPARNLINPLSSSIRTLIFEESSMIGLDLYKEVIDACPHNPQLIFLGDIQQLPPVFGPAILGFKMTELPTVELTDVYRQALESPIISLAHKILAGNPLEPEELRKMNTPGKLKFTFWSKKIDAHNAINTMTKFFCDAYDHKAYDPEEDGILIPFNKSFGTDELNKGIANHIARSTGQITYELIAGFNKLYLSPGDKVLHDKEDAVVLSITPNPSYTGAKPQKESIHLDYWGYNSSKDQSMEEDDELSDEQVDFMLEQMSSSEERVRAASHVVKLAMLDSGAEVELSGAAELNSLILGYAITVHKSQGSEWKKVFFLSHQSNATMMQRELLYTAVTRARESLTIVCEPNAFVNGIISQKVKGTTLQEKSEYFKGKAKERASTL